jgi:multidrug resistance efflux pump
MEMPLKLGSAIARVARRLATLVLVLLAGVAAAVTYVYYDTSPWTRDGRVRAQVANVAPQVSGQIVQLRVADNQFVHRGDVLYIIDPFDYQTAYTSAQANVQMKAADLQVKHVQSERRQKLTELGASVEEKQQFAGTAVQADAAFKDAQAKLAQAEINLKRTQVKSPVNGIVTNLLLRVGDYANVGAANISIIDSESYWIDGFFEETKIANICKGDVAEAQLMGYSAPIIGRVQSATRGISVSDASPGTQGLPSVDAVYTWVRLAQRVPIRIQIVSVPQGVTLVAGMTATVTIRKAQFESDRWRRLHWLETSLSYLFRGNSVGSEECLTPDAEGGKPVTTLPTPEPPHALPASEILPGLAPALNVPPHSG